MSFKSILAGLLSVVTIIPSAFTINPKVAELDMSRFEPVPVFADEFDGDSLNEDYWEYSFGSKENSFIRKGSFWNGRTTDVYDGNLHLRTAYYPEGIDGGPAGWYNSGIKTVNKIEYKYGYIETRCLVAATDGMLGSFWLNSSNMSYGRDVCKDGLGGTEIDIFESYSLGSGAPLEMPINIHTNGYGDELLSHGVARAKMESNAFETFHTYGMEWTPEKYIFYIDGKVVATYENSPENPLTVSQSQEYLLFTCEMGGTGGVSSKPDYNLSNTTHNGVFDFTHGEEDYRKYEADFIVDYVRIYKYKDSVGIPCELIGTAVDSLPEYNVITDDIAEKQESNGVVDNISYYSDGNEIAITDISADTEGAVIIPYTIGGLPVTEIADAAFANCKNITSVSLPDTVKSIGDYAFYFCTGLTGINLSDSLETIGNYAFSNCTSLEALKLPDTVSSIGKYAFEACFALSEFRIPRGITEIREGALSCCANLKSLEIPSSVTVIEDRALYRCIELCDLIYPSSVKTIGNEVFWHCRKLKMLDVSGAQSIGNGAFEGCKSLISIVLPDNLESIGSFTFKNCEQLSSVTIPDSVTSIGKRAFSKCYGLRTVNIPSSVDIIETGAFEYCESLESIVLPDKLTTINEFAFARCACLDGIVIPEGVTSIGRHAFIGCDSINSVVIPEGVSSLGYGAFAGCKGLENIAVNEGNAKFTTVDGVLYSADGKKLLQYPAGRNSYEFTIPDGTVTISENALTGAAKLVKVDFPDTVAAVDRLSFSSCPYLTEVNLSSNLKYISPYAFVNCKSLPYIRTPQSTYAIYHNSFSFCPNIRVLFAERVSSDKMNIDRNNFLNSSLDHAFITDSAVRSSVNAKTVHYNSSENDYEFTEYVLPTASQEGRVTVHCNICDVDITSVISPVEKQDNIVLDMNDGTGETTAVTVTEKLTYGKLPVPTRENYYFTGWYTKRVGGLRILPADIVDGTVKTLYAHWSGKPVSVSFDGTVKLVSFGGEYGIMPQADVWYSEETGGRAVYTNSKVENAQGHTLYSVQLEEYGTVIFNVNTERLDSSNIPDSIIVRNNEEYGTLPVLPDIYGYTFDGWFTDSTGGIEITADSIAKISSEQTLYAHWKPLQKSAYLDYNCDGLNMNIFAPMAGTHQFGNPTVSYDMETGILTANGWAEKSETLFSKPFTVKNGETYVLTYEYISGGYSGGLMVYQALNNNTSARCHCDMRNYSTTIVWNMDEVHEKNMKELRIWIWKSGSAERVNINNLKVRIKLEKVSSADDGATPYTSPAVSVGYESRYEYLPTPENENLRFLGWYTERDGGEKVTTDTVNTDLDDITLYAHWEADHTYVESVSKKATCTGCGEITYTCSGCGDTYTVETPPAGHNSDTGSVITSATCTTAGTREYRCTECGTVLRTEATAKAPHTVVTDVAVIPTCTESGMTEGSHCSVCHTVIVEQKIIGKKNHSDADNDYYCDECGISLGTSGSQNCSCSCHKSGFMGFIYKILRIFWKLFGIRKTCDCGAIHY